MLIPISKLFQHVQDGIFFLQFFILHFIAINCYTFEMLIHDYTLINDIW
jgi:hypothetical protein